MIVEVFQENKLSETRGSNTFHYQEAFIHRAESPIPDRFRIPLGSKQPPYAVGKYGINSEALAPNQWKKLELNQYEMVLVPVHDWLTKMTEIAKRDLKL